MMFGRKPKPQKVRRMRLPEGDKYVFQGGKKVLFITPEGRKLARENKGLLRRAMEGKIKATRRNSFANGGWSFVARIPGLNNVVVKQTRPRLRREAYTPEKRLKAISAGIQGMRKLIQIEKSGIKIPKQYFSIEERRTPKQVRITVPKRIQVMEEIKHPNAREFLLQHPEIGTEFLSAVLNLVKKLKENGHNKPDIIAFHRKTKRKDVATYHLRNIFVKSYDPATQQFEFIVIDQHASTTDRKRKTQK